VQDREPEPNASASNIAPPAYIANGLDHHARVARAIMAKVPKYGSERKHGVEELAEKFDHLVEHFETLRTQLERLTRWARSNARLLQPSEMQEINMLTVRYQELEEILSKARDARKRMGGALDRGSRTPVLRRSRVASMTTDVGRLQMDVARMLRQWRNDPKKRAKMAEDRFDLSGSVPGGYLTGGGGEARAHDELRRRLLALGVQPDGSGVPWESVPN
jgi:chromosome segregation ATPase